MTTIIPKYHRQKRKTDDIAFVELSGHRHYLGRYGTAENKQKYARLVAEWESSGHQPPVSGAEITIVELIARFWKHAQKHYRKSDGNPTSEIDNFRPETRPHQGQRDRTGKACA